MYSMYPVMDEEEWYREGLTCRLLAEATGFLYFFDLHIQERVGGKGEERAYY